MPCRPGFLNKTQTDFLHLKGILRALLCAAQAYGPAACCVEQHQSRWPKGREKQVAYSVLKVSGGRKHSTAPYLTEHSKAHGLPQLEKGREVPSSLCTWKLVSQSDLTNSSSECHLHTVLCSKPHLLDAHVRACTRDTLAWGAASPKGRFDRDPTAIVPQCVSVSDKLVSLLGHKQGFVLLCSRLSKTAPLLYHHQEGNLCTQRSERL